MNPTSHEVTLEHVSSCLNQAPAEALIALAERCLNDHAELMVTKQPTVGVVVAQVREPIAEERFILGDVMVCQAEVHRRGSYGWAMRMGQDTLATLATALLAAEFAAEGPRREAIIALCDQVVADRKHARAAEWERLAPSIVEFEEVL